MQPGPKRKVVAVQSSYVPWKGTFDLFRRADCVLLLDDLQFTRRDWRNRNRIKTDRGLRWLTVPVQTRGRFTQAIRDVEIADAAWADRHWRTLAHAYAGAAAFRETRDWLEPLYRGCRETRIGGVNRRFLEAVCLRLGITTPLREATTRDLPGFAASQRLAALCRLEGATTYLSGPTARAYLDEAPFRSAGITVEWMSYEGYPEYPQLHGPFEHRVSVLDLLFNTGSQARHYLDAVPPDRLEPGPPLEAQA